MTTNDHTQFDTWLDAFVAGMSTPASRAASDSTNAEVREAARQFHGLARHAERTAPEPSGIASSWEAFMSTQELSIGPTRRGRPRVGPFDTNGASPDISQIPVSHQLSDAPGMSPAATRRTAGPRTPYRGSRWHIAFNIALAALLVVTFGIGIWRATAGGFNGTGGGNDPGGGQQSAFAPETRVFTPEASDATPESVAELPLIPTAAECTVEPLTIDEVLWYVEDPAGASRSREMESVGTPESGQGAIATPGSETAELLDDLLVSFPIESFEPGPASPEQLDAIASVQRMWMACVLADSPFQRWALESPSLVAEQVQMLFPTFHSREEASAILEEVRAIGVLEPHEDFWKQPNASYQMLTSNGYPSLGSLALVEAGNAEAWTTDGRTFWVTYSSYQMDGTLERDGNLSAMHTPESDEPTPVPGLDGTGGCNRFGVIWFPDREDLLISYYPHCG
jgi:hypothetical protein